MAHDTTAAKRMAEWRKRMKSEGWQALTVWLPPGQVAELDGVLEASEDSRRDTLTKILQAGIEALSNRKTVTKDIRERRKTVTQGIKEESSDRKTVTQEIREQSDRNQVTPSPVVTPSERARYRERMILEGETLIQDGLSLQQIVDQWNERGRPPPSGRGKWNKQNLHRLLKRARADRPEKPLRETAENTPD